MQRGKKHEWLQLGFELTGGIIYILSYSDVRYEVAINSVYFSAMQSIRSFLANVNSPSRLLYAIVRPSVCRLSSVTFVHPTQAIEIFCNILTPFGTLDIY